LTDRKAKPNFNTICVQRRGWASIVWSQYTNSTESQTDRQTNRQTDRPRNGNIDRSRPEIACRCWTTPPPRSV